MKLDRLIAILSVLLQQDSVTAPELAARFEVSRRTISRDIAALNQAGIPIVTRQGAGGGISIMEGFRIERAALSSGDMRAILSGLRSLDSVSGSNRYRLLMEKLRAGASSTLLDGQPILIDLASWYKAPLSEKIDALHSAIEQHRRVSFRYYSPTGDSERTVEPYLLVFQWSSWYLWAWCLKRGAPRLFKLNRMAELTTVESFTPRELAPPDLSDARVFPARYRVVARVDSRYKWRLIDEYGADSFTALPDGNCLFSADFSEREHVLSWILSFQGAAELLEPAELRAELLEIGKKLVETYRT